MRGGALGGAPEDIGFYRTTFKAMPDIDTIVTMEGARTRDPLQSGKFEGRSSIFI